MRTSVSSTSAQIARAKADRADLIRGISVLILLLFGIALFLTACGQMGMRSGTNLSKRVVPFGQPVPKGGGRYKVGDPYKINGRWYHPREDRTYDRVGTASWYGELFHGRYTANGEVYDMDALSAAHPTLPMPVYARVTNLQNDRAIVVRINDRGPYAHDRVIDLSRRSAHLLGFRKNGTARVRVQYLGPAPLNGDDSYERQVLAQQSWARVADATAPRNVGPTVVRPPAAKTAEARLPFTTAQQRPRAVAAAPQRPRATTVVQRKSPAVGAFRKTIARVPAPSQVQPTVKRVKTIPITTASIRKPSAAPAKPTPPLTSAVGSVFVQTGAFRVKANAERMRDELAEIGTTHISPVNVRGGLIYRVRLGPFPERKAANRTLKRAAAAGIKGARIISN